MKGRELPIIGGHPQGAVATMRTDAWWIGPVATLAILLGFIVYATWAALQGSHYYVGPYLSPFYSPVVFTDTAVPGAAPLWHAWAGEFPSWWPALVPASPAVVILFFPGIFRFTCYYYRKAYYRAFAGAPPACAVGPVARRRTYRGETALLLFQNLHRYALYFALAFVVFLTYDAIAAFSYEGQLGIGVGSIILTINALLLAGYTFGCHSFRHLVGGHDDCMSCGRRTAKHGLWKRASWLNGRHMQFAWASLLWVAFSDVYVRLVSHGVIRDFNTWGF